MLLYEVLRGQWLLAALGGGLVLLLTTVAVYLALWRPRPDPSPGQDAGSSEEARRSPAKNLFLTLPVVLVMTYAGIVIFMAAYFAAMIASPPNW